MAAKPSTRTLSGDLKTKHVAWRLFLSAHAFIAKGIDRDLKAGGHMPYDWHDVLMALHEAPGERLRMGDLAEATLLSASGVSRRVERLEKEGLLAREQSPSDGRSTHAILTKKGNQALRGAWPVYRAAIERYFTDSLSRREAEILAEVFNDMLTRVAGPKHQYLYQNQITEEP